MVSGEPQRPFDDQKASAYIDAWVSTVADPELVWAWEIACGIIELYAEHCTTRKKSRAACRREQWLDWFESWVDGDAHFGVHAAMQQVEEAIPLEHWDSFWVTLNHARQIGETGRMPTDDSPPTAARRPRGAAVAPAAPPTAPAVVLRLVVNNESNHLRPPPRQR